MGLFSRVENYDSDSFLSWPDSEIGHLMRALEVEQNNGIEVMIAVGKRSTRLLTAQPHLHSAEVPLRKAYLRRPEDVCEMDWEAWRRIAPPLRRRSCPDGGQVLLTILGRQASQAESHGPVGPASVQRELAEDLRERRWEAVSRDLREASRRVHVKLGHPPQAT